MHYENQLSESVLLARVKQAVEAPLLGLS